MPLGESLRLPAAVRFPGWPPVARCGCGCFYCCCCCCCEVSECVAGEIVESVTAMRCGRRVGVGLESSLAYCVVVYFGLVAPFHKHDWRQPRSPSRSSKRQRTEALPGCWWASGRVDVYTRGWQESDCLNNAHWSTWRDAEVATVFVYVLVVNCASDVLFHEHAQRQPRPPTFRSKRQLAQAKNGCLAFVKAKATGRVDVHSQG